MKAPKWYNVAVILGIGLLVLTVAGGLASAFSTAPHTFQNGKVLYTIPFTCQAPNGQWKDPVQADGCEEACILMISAGLAKETAIDTAFVVSEMHKMADYEKAIFGSYTDTGLDDTIRLLKWYELEKVELYSFPYLPYVTKVSGEAVSVESMKNALYGGSILLVPINGQKLDHPYYHKPGPLVHMVLVVGYDDERGVFIINDPGTKHGEGMSIFSYEEFFAAMGDYRTGEHFNKPGDEREKAFVGVTVVFRHSI